MCIRDSEITERAADGDVTDAKWYRCKLSCFCLETVEYRVLAHRRTAKMRGGRLRAHALIAQ